MDKISFIKSFFNQEKTNNSSKCINNLSYVLEDIKNLFCEDQFKKNDCTTLADVLNLMNKYNSKYRFVTDNYSGIFDTIVKRIYPHSSLYIEDYDFNNRILKINFTNYNYNEPIFISVNEYNKFCVLNNRCKYSEFVLRSIDKYLEKLFFELDKFKGFKTQHSYVLKSSNTRFRVDINNHSVKLYYRVIADKKLTDFEIKKDIFKNYFSYNCNSQEILDITRGHEKELFKRVFVKIDDCPEWSKSLLTDISQSNKNEQVKTKIKTFA